MKRRNYAGEADVRLLQKFNSEAIAVTDHCGYVHPGDIPYRLFGGNKIFDPAEVLEIWEDEQGVAGWLLIGPRHKSYDAQIRPDLRGGSFEREVLEYADNRTIELMRKHNIDTEQFYADAFQGDTVRSELLVELGWKPDEKGSYILTRAALENVEEPVLPEGYSIRAVRGIEEAAAIVEVRLAAFPGAGWTPELYQRVMEAPGYSPEHEYVVVAPDGSFAAFTTTWRDEYNKIGYFEPVGTHKDHRRRGLGKAVVLYGMQQMAAGGMKFASVAHFANNAAAGGLYAACGFKPWHKLDDYTKPVSG